MEKRDVERGLRNATVRCLYFVLTIRAGSKNFFLVPAIVFGPIDCNFAKLESPFVHSSLT